MPDSVDNLVISASVLDDFSDTLDELKQELGQIQGAHSAVDPIDIDARVANAMSKLVAVEGMLESIDEDINIGVDVDEDTENRLLGGEAHEFDIFDQPGGQLGRHDALGAFQGARNLDPLEMDENRFRRVFMGGAESLFDATMGGPMGMVSDTGATRRQELTETVRQFANLKLRMGQFMTLMANLLPIFGVFVGALPAAIAGVTALGAAAFAAAGVLGGVVGLGLLGMATTGGEWNFDQMRQQIQGLIDDFLSAFTPFANAVVPLMEEGISRLSGLFFELAQVSRMLLQSVGSARGLMNWVADTLPSVAADIIGFGQAALPVLAELGQRMAGVDWIGIFADLLARTIPLLVQVGLAVWRMLPAIFEVSMGFLQVAAVITSLISVFFQLIDIIPIGAQLFGSLIAAMLVALTVTGLYTLATSKLAAAIGAMALRALPVYIEALYRHVAAQISSTIATWSFYAAAAAVVGLLTLGLVPIISTVTTGFGIMGSEITSATERLREFNRVGSNMPAPNLGGVSGSGLTGPQYSKPSSTTVVAPDKETGNAIASSLAYNERQSKTTDQDDVDNSKHSG